MHFDNYVLIWLHYLACPQGNWGYLSAEDYIFYQGKKPFMLLLTMEPNPLMTGHIGLFK